MAILTDKLIKNTKPEEKPIHLADGEGLLLLVNPNGSKWWRFRYRFQGKAKMLSFGVYPEVSLRKARDQRDEARRLLGEEIDPSAFRKSTKTRVTNAGMASFESVAREWFAKMEPTWAKGHSEKIIQRLERDVFPWLGAKNVGAITAPEILACIRRIEERGSLDTAHRAKQNIGQVIRYAIATGRAERNPVPDLQGALPSVRGEHYAAIIEPAKFGQLLRAIDGYGGFLTARCALKLLPLLFVRPGELRGAEWSEIDLDGSTWSIPGSRMKLKEPHIVPLATQSMDILRDLQSFSGGGKFVFPSPRNKGMPISDMALSVGLKSLGFSGQEMTCHGFRASARTLLDEVLEFRIDWIEHQLAHAVRDPLGRSYNRTTHLPERRKMMQAWADYLDGLKADVK